MPFRARARLWNAETAEPGESAGKQSLCAFFAFFVFCVLTLSACAGGMSLFRQYEYEEEIYLSLDGTATVYVNSSLAALNALRGTSFDTSPAARFDAAAVRAYFTTPQTQVARVSSSRRNNRRFAHVRLDVTDIHRLAEAAPFAWSTYRFQQRDNLFIYLQSVGTSAGKDPGASGWTGRELVAFRLHLPSDVGDEHNAGDANHLRGNILVWEQTLADRLHGRPLAMIASMETESILSHTLRLFGITFLAVAVTFGSVVWWIMRPGAKPART